MSSFQNRLRKLFSRENLPRSRAARIALDITFVVLGLVGFLPVLGFWIVPLGVAILAVDVPIVGRFSRRVRVVFGRWWKKIRKLGHAHKRPTKTQAKAYVRTHTQGRAPTK